MKVTGYKLQHAIRELEQYKELLTSKFEASLRAFPGEFKDPTGVMRLLQETEEKLVILQDTQARYNQTVQISVLNEKVSLSRAVKAVGGVGRIEKMWRTAAQGKRNPWGGDELIRNPTEVRAASTIEPEDALAAAKVVSKRAAALREAIQVGNATEVEIDLDPLIFD
jgi:hypothetical protein